MSWSASRMLLRSGSIFLHSLFLTNTTAFLNHQKSGENLQEFYPDKKPLEAKAKKDYGETLWTIFNVLMGHIHGIVDNGNCSIQEGVGRQRPFAWCWLHLWLRSLLKLDFRKQGLPSWQGSGCTLPLFSGKMMIRHRQLTNFLSDWKKGMDWSWERKFQAIITTPVGPDGKSRELAIVLANRFRTTLSRSCYLVLVLSKSVKILANRLLSKLSS